VSDRGLPEVWTDHDQPVTPEVRLFRYVVLNAVLDAIYGSSASNEKRIKIEAWNWFIRGNDDFRKVCECAGWHPDTVRRKAIAYIQAQREQPDSPKRPPINSHGELRKAA
jgi:hypothetical protein